MKDEVLSFYKDFFFFCNRVESLGPWLVVDNHPLLSYEAVQSLLKPVSKEEVWRALNFMGSYKALGQMASNQYFSKLFGILLQIIYLVWLGKLS